MVAADVYVEKRPPAETTNPLEEGIRDRCTTQCMESAKPFVLLPIAFLAGVVKIICSITGTQLGALVGLFIAGP